VNSVSTFFRTDGVLPMMWPLSWRVFKGMSQLTKLVFASLGALYNLYWLLSSSIPVYSMTPTPPRRLTSKHRTCTRITARNISNASAKPWRRAGRIRTKKKPWRRYRGLGFVFSPCCCFGPELDWSMLGGREELAPESAIWSAQRGVWAPGLHSLLFSFHFILYLSWMTFFHVHYGSSNVVSFWFLWFTLTCFTIAICISLNGY
jgi:hypothetical protein